MAFDFFSHTFAWLAISMLLSPTEPFDGSLGYLCCLQG